MYQTATDSRQKMRAQHQAPLNELNRRSSLKKSQKTSKKSLYPKLSSAEFSKDLAPKVPPSDVFNANQDGNSDEGSLLDFTPDNLAPLDIDAISDVTWLSPTTEKYEKSNISINHCGSTSQSHVHSRSVLLEVEELSDLLKRARTQVVKPADVDHRSRKILNALIKSAVEDFHGLPVEKNIIDKRISARILVIFIAFLLALIVLATSGSNSSYRGPLPT